MLDSIRELFKFYHNKTDVCNIDSIANKLKKQMLIFYIITIAKNVVTYL